MNYRRSGVACVPPSAKFAIIKRPHAAADFEGSALTAQKGARTRSFFFPANAQCGQESKKGVRAREAAIAAAKTTRIVSLLSFRWPQPKLLFGFVKSENERGCVRAGGIDYGVISLALNAKREKKDSLLQ